MCHILTTLLHLLGLFPGHLTSQLIYHVVVPYQGPIQPFFEDQLKIIQTPSSFPNFVSHPFLQEVLQRMGMVSLLK